MRDTDRLFAYGTLVPGGRYFSVVERFVATTAAATVTGTLYDTGAGYPAAVFHEPGPALHGVVLDFVAGATADALAALDRFEGPEYRRVVVSSTAGAAWAYEWAGPVTDLVVIGEGRFT